MEENKFNPKKLIYFMEIKGYLCLNDITPFLNALTNLRLCWTASAIAEIFEEITGEQCHPGNQSKHQFKGKNETPTSFKEGTFMIWCELD